MMRRLFSLMMLAVCLGSLYGCFAGLQEDAPVAPQASPDASIQATADSEPLTEPMTESITDPITEPSAEPSNLLRVHAEGVGMDGHLIEIVGAPPL